MIYENGFASVPNDVAGEYTERPPSAEFDFDQIKH